MLSMKLMSKVMACLLVIIPFVITIEGVPTLRDTFYDLEYEVPQEAAILKNQNQIWNKCVNHSGEYDEFLATFNKKCSHASDGLRNCNPVYVTHFLKYRYMLQIIANDCEVDYKDRDYNINEESGITAELFNATRKEHFKQRDGCFEVLLQIEDQWKADAMKSCMNYKKCYAEPDSFYKPKLDKALSLKQKYTLLLATCSTFVNQKLN